MTIDKMSSFQVMKSMNQQTVLNTIYQSELISRVEIAEKVGLTQQTITNIVSRLIEEGVVVEEKSHSLTPSAGRRPIPLRINSSHLFAIGIEVARKRVRGVLTDFSQNILAETDYVFVEIESSEQIFNKILHVIDILITKCMKPEQIKGIGLTVSGPIDQRSGIVIKAEHFHWINFQLKDELERLYPYPVYVENDVNIIAVAENATGILSDSQNNITLLLDQGVGGAIVIDKKLYVGSNNAAGEFGNFKVHYKDESLPCDCGVGYGSLTTIASITAIQRKMGVPFALIIERIDKREPEIIRELQLIGEAVGSAISNIVTFFNPDTVLLTGRLIENAGFILEPVIIDIVKKTTFEGCRNVMIKSTVLMDGAKMASGLVLKEMLK